MFIAGKVRQSVEIAWGEEEWSGPMIGFSSLHLIIQSFAPVKVWQSAERRYVIEGPEGVHCAYGFSDVPLTPPLMRDAQIAIAEGQADAEISARYSDVTGFLWIESHCRIGGHDLEPIFEQNIGRWAGLIIQTEPIDLLSVPGPWFIEMPDGDCETAKG